MVITGRSGDQRIDGTGTFTTAAKSEAVRAGTTPIELVDGDRLCDLPEHHGIGVQVRQVEQVTVDSHFFADV